MYIKDEITVLVRAAIGGPTGKRLKPGQFALLEDGAYVRLMIKSGAVALVDPPSLDPEYLEKAGYELKEGYEYPAKTIEEPVVVEPVVEKPAVKETYLTRSPKKRTRKISEEKKESSDEKEDSEKSWSPTEITGM